MWSNPPPHPGLNYMLALPNMIHYCSETDSEDGATTESSGLERSRIIYNLEGNFAADD